MSSAIEGLKPQLVWKYFAEISKIPRASKHETAMTKYVVETARKLGLPAKTDKFGNVAVKKPASRGKEHVRSIALQGHFCIFWVDHDPFRVFGNCCAGTTGGDRRVEVDRQLITCGVCCKVE